MKHLAENSSAWIVIELVSVNCIADQSSNSCVAEPMRRE
jgi:hypothetical protein